MEREKHILDYYDKTHKGRANIDFFQTILDSTINHLGKKETYEISLTLVDRDEIHELNKKYRDMDRPTDVLTFASMEADFVEDEPVIDLGSIIICPEIAKEQAKSFKHPYKRELAFLFIHGLLHSFGYDHHDSEAQSEEMFALQNDILNHLPIDFYTNQARLKKELLLAQQGSIAPYSNFHVGAVVVTKDGKYHRGFNIENSAFGDCICGERCALFHTYASGYHKEDIVALGLVTSSSNVGTPCGSCRQVMSELMELNCPVYIYNKDESKSLFTTVGDLLPSAFTPEDYHA
jgi:cytidine deaminase